MAFVRISDIEIYSYQTTLKRPLKIYDYSILSREGLILKVKNDLGASVYVEAAPLPHFHKETLKETVDKLANVKEHLIGSFWSTKLLLSSDHILSKVLDYKKYPCLYFALEFALLCHLMPKLAYFQDIHINALLSGDDKTVLEQSKLVKDYPAIKVKASNRSPIEMLKLMESLIFNDPHRRFRIDFNRSWQLSDLVEFCSHFPIENCDYLEEPLKNPLELLAFSDKFGHPLAFDESLIDTSIEFLLTLPSKVAFVVKPTVIGSLEKIHFLYSKARLHRLDFILTSTFESGIGHLMIAQLAHYLAIEEPIGLDTYHWIEEDLLLKPLSFKNGTLSLKDQHLLNPYIDTNKLTPLESLC